MSKIKSFLGLTLLGGIAVVLPIAILVVLFRWLFALVTGFIQPLSDLLISEAGIQSLVADLLVVVVSLGLCFTIGLLVKTGLGRWLHYWLDTGLVKFAPGYRTIRDLVMQFMGGDSETSLLRGQVALVRLYGDVSEIWVTCIITARYGDICTVFAPTAPVPTSGMVYHVPSKYVQMLPNVTVEQAMKTVIGCGSGSQTILKTAEEQQ